MLKQFKYVQHDSFDVLTDHIQCLERKSILDENTLEKKAFFMYFFFVKCLLYVNKFDFFLVSLYFLRLNDSGF